MRDITAEELEMVAGAFGPVGAVGGAVAGVATYLGNQTGGGSINAADLAIAAGVGALVGAATGPVGIGGIATGTALGFGGGVIAGNGSRLWGSASTGA
ncbi:hypothetical protein WR25_08625 [Diploscapter pachys]|uniref:Uncharacterized protein n=1 Tax=Diploscapter pachys TaxID=2018661 RepID=A0A2A2JY44_9BILA|nr:hypothetical protein WR25_08625 [Diploscapter pachys]